MLEQAQKVSTPLRTLSCKTNGNVATFFALGLLVRGMLTQELRHKLDDFQCHLPNIPRPHINANVRPMQLSSQAPSFQLQPL